MTTTRDYDEAFDLVKEGSARLLFGERRRIEDRVDLAQHLVATLKRRSSWQPSGSSSDAKRHLFEYV
jgi:hypothetical protein